MPWLSRNDFTAADFLHADDLNNLANDQRTWGGPVNGGGYVLSNVILEGVTTLAAGGVVTSVFGRAGDVVAVAGDYTAAQVGAVPTATRVIAGTGLAGGGPLSADVTLTAAVTSVFGRTGAITLTPTDITNATGVLQSRAINTGTGLTGGGNLSADRTLSIVPDSVNQQVQVLSAGAVIGTRHAINFVSGANITVSVSDNIGSNRVDVTVSSTGGTGGMADPTTTLGDLIVRGLSAPTRLGVGTNGQILTADSTQPTGLKWGAAPGGGAVTSVFGRMGIVVAATGDYSASQVTNAVDATAVYNNPPWITSLPWAKITNPPVFLVDPTTSKGDLIVHGAATTRLPVGADAMVLTADSAQPSGLRWGALAVTSVFGRTGDVAAAAGDYTAAQVTGAVATTRQINTSTGLTGGGNLSADRTFSVVPDTTNQQVVVLLGGTVIGTRHAVNFINGANVSLSISDNSTNNRIDLTVSSTGGSGGMVDPTTTVGDLLVRGSTVPQRLGVGANGQVLTADSAQLLGMRWATPAAGGPGSQTPWVSNIDAAAFNLNNVNGIGLNAVATPTTAHIYVVATGTEECFLGANNNAANLASATVANDIGDYLRIRSYGTGHTTTPGIGSFEASKALAISANGSEVMRLTAGHVLIGTITDDGLHPLQVNGAIKSLAGGYVFPDGTIQTTAFTTASSAVTSVFGRTGAVVALSGDYTAAKVTNAVDSTVGYANPTWITSLAWSKITGAPAYVTDPTTTQGDIIARTASATTRLGVGANGQVLTADSTQATGLKWGAGPSQTPWLSDIDAATHNLGNVLSVGIGVPAQGANQPLCISSAHTNYTIFATNLNNSGAGVLVLSNDNVKNFAIGMGGSFCFPIFRRNNAFLSSDGDIVFGTQTTERVRITNAGSVGIGTNAPTSFVHASLSQNSWTQAVVQNTFVGTVAAALVTAAASNAGISLMATSGGYTANGSLLASEGCVYTAQNLVLASDGAAIKFISGTGMTERMRVHTSGNVGIGTTAPAGRLEVAGRSYFTGASEQYTVGVRNSAAGNPYWIGAASNGDLTFSDSTGAEHARLTVAGNLGINTGTPTSLMHVVYQTTGMSPVGSMRVEGTGDPNYALIDFKVSNMLWQVGAGSPSSYFPNVWFLYNATTGTYPLFCNSNGYVSIGTQYTTSSLTLAGSAGAPSLSATRQILTMFTVSGGNGQILEFGGYPGSPYGNWIQGSYNGNPGYSTPITLQPVGGSVGIGIATPVAVLEVFGTTNPPSLSAYGNSTLTVHGSVSVQIEMGTYPTTPYAGWIQAQHSSAAGAYALVLQPLGGPLGVGTSNPIYSLDVAGDVNCTGTFRVNGTAVGGSWAIAAPYFCTPTGTRVVSTNYQNPYSVPIHVTVIGSLGGNGGMMWATVGPSSGPTQDTAAVTNTSTTGAATLSIHFIVLPGYYYLLNINATSLTILSCIEWK